MKNKFTYICENCGSAYAIKKDLMLCPLCRENDLEGKPLKGVLKVQLPASLKKSKKVFDDFDIHDYLPVERKYFPSLPVGNTPLIKARNIEKESGYSNLFLKFDGTNPTGSYKDRASFLVSAFANKFKLNNIALASTGNAASSMSGIAAAAGQKTFIFLPSSAPKAKLIQCLQYGATLIPIKGNYDSAFDLSLKFSAATSYLNRNTAYNPMTIEGKKTASFELISQLKKDIDFVFIPVGDGVCLDGVIKGFLDLNFLGLIKRIPRIIGVQSKGSRFIYDAFNRNIFNLNYKASTIADSVSVDAARNGYSAVSSLKRVSGDVILVSDNEILKAQKYLSEKSGIFCEPSSAASYAGFLKYRANIRTKDVVVMMLTGHGLKDIESAQKIVKLPEPIEPDIDLILKKLRVR